MPITVVPPVGIHRCAAAAVYHSWRALSHSWMQKLRISPAHLADLIENDNPRESSESQEFGTAVHCRVLEADEYPKRYVIRPEGQDGRSKAGKEFGAAAEQKGQTVLSSQEGRWCEAIALRAKSNYLVGGWMRHSRKDGLKNTEVSLVWERDGFLCKARTDLVVPDLHVVADLKTTRSASKDGFAREIARYRYHEQAAWYLDGIRRLTGQMWDFYFIACEKGRPFLVTCHQLVRDSPAHQLAVVENDRLFDLYKTCCQTRQWPGYADVFEIELPEWALSDPANVVDTIVEEEF